MTDETRILASFAAALEYDRIPEHVRLIALDLIVNTLGCTVGGSDLPWAQQVREASRKSGGAAEATVARYGDRLPVDSAAFINSTFAHSFEYDDGNPLFHGHPGAELIPAFMAIAERDHVSGCEFLTAFVAAYEIRGHIGWALSPDMNERGGPHYSTTCGPFAVAAGAARLLRLGAEGIHEAMSIAGVSAGGLMQYGQGGGSVKRIYTAAAARTGLQAATLAQFGMTGPQGILEGERGLLRIYSQGYRPERLVERLGDKWTMETRYFKPYSCCGGIFAAIDALRNLVSAHKFGADDVESVQVGYKAGTARHVAITRPTDLLGMQFSTGYSLALTMLKGGNTPREYTARALTDPHIQSFAAKVSVGEDAELTRLYKDRLPARVTVRLKSGAVHENLVIDARGSAGSPLSSVDIDDKFRSQVADILGAQRCERVLQMLRNIASVKDVAELPPLLVCAKS